MTSINLEIGQYMSESYLDSLRYQGQFAIFVFRNLKKNLVIELNFDCPLVTDDQNFNKIMMELKSYDSDSYHIANYVKFNNKAISQIENSNGHFKIKFQTSGNLIFKLSDGFVEPFSLYIIDEKQKLSKSISIDRQCSVMSSKFRKIE